MPGIRSLFLILAVLPALAGCQLKPRFDVGYEVPAATRSPASAGSVLVLPFKDNRPPKLYSSQGRMFLTYIPILPYVTIPFNRIDEIALDIAKKGGSAFSLISPNVQKIESAEDVHFSISFPATIAHDLQRSRVFERAEFFRERPAGKAFDYILKGTLQHTEYRVTASSYCLGMVGVLLWILPVPMCKVTGELELELVLEDASSGDVVWTGTVTGDEHSYRTMYGTSSMIHGTGLGAFTFQIQKGSSRDHLNPYSLFWWSFMALRDAMEQIKPELERALSARASRS